MALGLNASSIHRPFIDYFLRIFDFHEEVRFSVPHGLGSFLRRGLSRSVRIVSGIKFRGVIDREFILRWRHVGHSENLSKTELSSLVGLVHPRLCNLILTLFSFLLANVTSSGLTPATLASLFGPLLFGSPTSSFHAVYHAYLRSANATEHLLLSYVRLQISEAPPSAPTPRRLIRVDSGSGVSYPGYPIRCGALRTTNALLQRSSEKSVPQLHALLIQFITHPLYDCLRAFRMIRPLIRHFQARWILLRLRPSVKEMWTRKKQGFG